MAIGQNRWENEFRKDTLKWQFQTEIAEFRCQYWHCYFYGSTLPFFVPLGLGQGRFGWD